MRDRLLVESKSKILVDVALFPTEVRSEISEGCPSSRRWNDRVVRRTMEEEGLNLVPAEVQDQCCGCQCECRKQVVESLAKAWNSLDEVQQLISTEWLLANQDIDQVRTLVKQKNKSLQNVTNDFLWEKLGEAFEIIRAVEQTAA